MALDNREANQLINAIIHMDQIHIHGRGPMVRIEDVLNMLGTYAETTFKCRMVDDPKNDKLEWKFEKQ